jgi:hypothetical protein
MDGFEVGSNAVKCNADIAYGANAAAIKSALVAVDDGLVTQIGRWLPRAATLSSPFPLSCRWTPAFCRVVPSVDHLDRRQSVIHSVTTK